MFNYIAKFKNLDSTNYVDVMLIVHTQKRLNEKYGTTFCDFEYFDLSFDKSEESDIKLCNCCKENKSSTSKFDRVHVCKECVAKLINLPTDIKEIFEDIVVKWIHNLLEEI
jgi:hypothetical protein